MFPPKIFQLFPNYKNLIVFSNCDPRFHYLENFTCSNGGLVQCITMNITTSCRTISNVIVPAGFIPEKEAWNLENVLRGGFEVKLDINERPCKQCLKTGGLQFRQVCKSVLLQRRLFFYPNRIKEFSGSLLGFKCIKTSSGELPKSSAGADPTSFNYLLTGSRDRSIRTSKNREFEELIPLKRYSYAEVKEITNLFAQEIGRGGYGIVYEGNLCEGLKVAVKVLKESKKNVEDFINEVAIHNEPAPLRIDLGKMYDIALGVARGLQYLHYACKTRIVHFDIKPQNILLGKDFCPKISDFGLARAVGVKKVSCGCQRQEGPSVTSHPKCFKNLRESLSHKSDVYSYGMLVLEMMGAKK
ncbi:LEAF RUST 10 DISEASE-RESISTANCE LOCUS RECEPTOR-LIKE PROTEIN KINASE-like 2.7 [Brassica napus]|uniref:LEAF RUST 10 DISEASE-RESISTANCE LOCUS RECEPTOR-LIKE PROTEIN KINASE-like 2.7 n=1 Tax=Brassica napus TaxID=3708 RepID=UPI002078E6BD|nr:LEAF RUST 10 DISEASE-RESISTANCE LOCUS RECEPTOR-LIKE PROTEIN KINASE-like 2.7 [Brassica napus]